MGDGNYYLWSIVIQGIGIAGLAYYAYKTRQIANETVRNNEILTTPVVSVQVLSGFLEVNGEITQLRDTNPGDIKLQFRNLTRLHSEITIRIWGEIGIDAPRRRVESNITAYQGMALWHITALDSFRGHCPLFDSSELQTMGYGQARVCLEVQSRKFGSDSEFESNPAACYEWTGKVWDLRPTQSNL